MAIYQSTNLVPRNNAIDASVDNNFTCQVNGTLIDKYRLRIFLVSNNNLVYDSMEQTITPALVDKDTLTVLVPAASGMSNGNEYKWSIQTFEGSNSATSIEISFFANTNPVVTLTVPDPITTQSHTFTPVYTQAEGIPIEESYFIFSDGQGNQILRTPDNLTGNLSYTFNGFLSGESYQVQFFWLNARGVSDSTPINNFSVTYSAPNINIKPTPTQDRNTSIINIAWSNIVVIPGVSTGTFSYIDNFGYQGNSALDLDANSTVSWDVNIPEQFSTIFRIQLQAGFTGDLPEHIIGSSTYRVGYDGTRWYFNNRGAQGFSQPIALSTNILFIVVRPTDVVIYDKTANTFTKLVTN